MAIFLGLETDVSERVVIPYANSPKLCKDTNCFGKGHKKKTAHRCLFFFPCSAAQDCARHGGLCIPLAELLCPQVKKFRVKQKTAVLRTACFFVSLSASLKQVWLAIRPQKKDSSSLSFLFPL